MHQLPRPSLLSLIALVLILGACAERDPAAATKSYPLRGLHVPLACSACHAGADLKAGLPRDCGGCHLQDRPPIHEPFACEQCHTEDGWSFAVTDHNFFPLDYGHDGPACVDCHEGDYVGTSPICASCHEQDRPTQHAATPCEDCHDIRDWGDAEIDHGFFPLEFGHDGPSCEDCHGDQGEVASPVCSSCHQQDRPAQHSSAPCEGCHNIRDWGDAEIDHSFFPLTWGHQGPSCENCHDGPYEDASAVCGSCHEQDAPSAHFGGACDDCHDTHDWGNATFNHGSYFPVPHEGVSACESCHVANDGYQSFSCIDCHEHNETATYFQHFGRSGYAWESSACLSCHPDGRE